MSKHQVIVEWQLSGPSFVQGQYSRSHTWLFDGGLKIPASPSPVIVREPWSNPEYIDPEEAFVASVSSCHMLTLLWLAAKQKHTVSSYRDEAIAVMSKNKNGSMWVSQITLRPEITWRENKVSSSQLSWLHHEAHKQCFIAQSVRTEISVQIQ